MAYNPYNYGYQTNPYVNNNYYNNQSYYPTQNQQVQQSQASQQIVIPLTFTNGFMGAKTYTMLYPNSTIYLRDNESDRLYIKTCDSRGQSTLESYRLVKEEIDENGNSINKKEVEPVSPNYLTKEDLEEVINNFINKDDLEALEKRLVESMNKILTKPQNAFYGAKNKQNNQNIKKGR